MGLKRVFEFLFESNLYLEAADTTHRWILRPMKKGNRFAFLFFIVAFSVVLYLDALDWSRSLVPYAGFMIIRAALALLLCIPDLVRFPLLAHDFILWVLIPALAPIWLFGVCDGLLCGPGSEKKDRPGLFYLAPLGVFGYMIFTAVTGYLFRRVGFAESVIAGTNWLWMMAGLAVLWPALNIGWMRMEKIRIGE